MSTGGNIDDTDRIDDLALSVVDAASAAHAEVARLKEELAKLTTEVNQRIAECNELRQAYASANQRANLLRGELDRQRNRTMREGE